MLRRLVDALRLRSAARKYARRLGAQLRADYGAGEHYNRAQIEASARRAQLPGGYMRLGYAGFMNETAFLELNQVETVSTYQELRAVLQRHTPARQPSSEIGTVLENQYAVGSVPSWPRFPDS